MALGPFGGVKVQLTALPLKHASSPMPTLWLEIFSCSSRATIDGYGCFGLGEEELAAAVEIILSAMQRNPYPN
ncbi:hypothetical protein AA309_15650 [Microvirga vignae]|uniref:Uncharacterized protein n=1 Tax=Microvirga vignae TaxID=1225564 RepID=A0A0H1RHY5_9HYPH|nr:hypothetical protein AA309_15650 [Microvirga vignae]